MIEKILQLGKETAIYGLSSVVGRFINFLLVPLYTNFLLPSEYGVIATIYSYIAFLFIVYGFGMEAAYMRFVAKIEIGNRKQNFSTPLFFLVISSTVLSLLIHGYSPFIAAWINIAQSDGILIQYAAWILCFDALATIPFAALRMENKALTFAGIRLANILLNVILNLVLIVGLGMKAEGVLIANLIASSLTFLVLLRFVFERFTWSFSFPLFRELLKFGLPYIPAGLGGVAMQVVDRPILKALTDDATVGIYQANYKLGIFMMLLVGMFDYAWRPFFLKHAWEKDAKVLFAKVFTLFCVFMFSVFIVLSLFIKDLVTIQIFGKYFIHPDYWIGISIVPLILLAYVFNGAYVNFVIGIYIEKKTHYLPYITGLGAITNIMANFLLIPVYGLFGAAIATLLCYFVIAIGVYFSSRKFYEVPYEWGKITKLSIITVSLYALYALGADMAGMMGEMVFRIILCACFFVSLPIFGIIDRKEFSSALRTIRGAMRKD